MNVHKTARTLLGISFFLVTVAAKTFRRGRLQHSGKQRARNVRLYLYFREVPPEMRSEIHTALASTGEYELSGDMLQQALIADHTAARERLLCQQFCGGTELFVPLRYPPDFLTQLEEDVPSLRQLQEVMEELGKWGGWIYLSKPSCTIKLFLHQKTSHWVAAVS